MTDKCTCGYFGNDLDMHLGLRARQEGHSRVKGKKKKKNHRKNYFKCYTNKINKSLI